MNDSDELKKKLIKSVKIVAKRAVLFSNIILLPVIIIIVLLAASVYFITVDDGTYDEDDWSSVPFAAAKSTSDSNISKDGAISTKYTAQETWDKIKENKGRVNLYLDDATELAKLMNAELVTQFLDTRSNPDEPIDWEKEIDPESKDVQGIIKLKRADADGNKSTMTYVDPETFQSYIEDYNKSGSEDAKQKVLSHFTLEQEDESDSDDSDSDIGIIKGNGTFTQYTDLTDAQIKAIANLCKQEQGSPKGAAAEASLMANRFELVGSRFGTGGAGLYNYVRKSGWFAHAASHMDNGSATKEYIDVVKGVLVNGKRTLPKYIDEHDCFTDISSATNKGQAISVSDRSQYKQYVTKMNNRYGAKYTFFCFPTETSDPFGYTSKKSRKKYGDAYYDFDTGNLINGTENSSTDNSSLTDDDKKSESDSNSSGDSSTWKWPTDGTRISSTFGLRSAPVQGASTDHGGIDIGVAEGTNVYACDSGKVTIAGASDTAGNWIEIDHGNGYVTKYMHNSVLKVKEGDKVEKGQLIALSGNTGRSSGAHLHFQVEHNGEKVDPLTFKYDNGMGDGSTSTSNSSGDLSNSESNSNSGGYYAKVATWKETTDTIKTNDPEVQSTYEITNGREEKVVSEQHTMDTAIINYQDFVKGYTMPFQYLWALLVIGEDKDFVMQLADLVYNSELEITVHDNLTVNTDIKVDTYTKKTRTDTNGQVTISYGQGSSVQNVTEKGNWTNEESNKYETTYKTVEKTNTLETALTRANVWIVDYTQEYTYKKPTENTTKNENKLEDKNYGNTPDSTSNDDTYGHVNALLEEKKKVETEETYDFVEGRIDSIDTKVYHATVDRNRKTTNTVETTQYISSPGKTKEKTDKKAKEPNFVNILLKDECKKAKKNIIQVRSWLYEILENNDTTKDMIDLTKYLLYKVTGKDYGVKEYEFNVYEPDKFVTVSDSNEISGGSVEEKVWFALKDKGFNEYAIAGVMGNIYGESGFNPKCVEGGYNENNGGIGICQWTNSGRGSTGRNTNLKKYAQSKGTTWQDEKIQIQFLLTELTGNGDARGYAGKAFIANSMYGKRYSESDWKNATNIEDATKAFCATFERPGKEYFNSSMPKRTKAAQDYYNKYHGKEKPSNTSSSNESGGNQDIVSTAKSKIGSPYAIGAKGPNSFDCSGFVYWVYKQHNITVPGSTDAYKSYQGSNKEISWNQAQPGDILVVFNTERGTTYGHAGIFLGGDKYIHSPQTGDYVKISTGAKSKFKHVFRFGK